MITSSITMALNNHCATALGPRLGLGLRLDFGSQVWFVQYFSENLVVVSPVSGREVFFFCVALIRRQNAIVDSKYYLRSQVNRSTYHHAALRPS